MLFYMYNGIRVKLYNSASYYYSINNSILLPLSLFSIFIFSTFIFAFIFTFCNTRFAFTFDYFFLFMFLLYSFFSNFVFSYENFQYWFIFIFHFILSHFRSRPQPLFYIFNRRCFLIYFIFYYKTPYLVIGIIIHCILQFLTPVL